MKTISLNRIFNIVFVLFLSFFLGCASNKPAPEHVLAGTKPLTKGDGRIIFYVSKRSRHPHWRPAVTLNGDQVGKAIPGGFFYVDRAPGNYEISHLVTTTVQGKRNSVEERGKKTFTLQAGKTLYVQMVLTPGTGMEPRMGRYEPMFLRPVLVAPEQAKKDITSCRYTGE